jgi:hypothetical protein
MADGVKKSGSVVYVMKYALTSGIVRTTTTADVIEGDKYVDVRYAGGISGQAVFQRNEVVWTEEEARHRYEELRVARIASLKKNIEAVSKKKPRILDQVP